MALGGVPDQGQRMVSAMSAAARGAGGVLADVRGWFYTSRDFYTARYVAF